MAPACLRKTHFHTLKKTAADITFLQRSIVLLSAFPTLQLVLVCGMPPQAASNHGAEVSPATHGGAGGKLRAQRGMKHRYEPRGDCGSHWPGAHGTGWLTARMSAAITTERANGTYLSHGPTCRLDWSQCFWALAPLAPQAKVVSGGHQPGRGSSGAGCTWAALCRTRPLTSSRPERGETAAQSAECRAAPHTAHPRRPACPPWCKAGKCSVEATCNLLPAPPPWDSGGSGKRLAGPHTALEPVRRVTWNETTSNQRRQGPELNAYFTRHPGPLSSSLVQEIHLVVSNESGNV